MFAKRRADLALGVVALVIGAGSLAHPFGRDQGLYFYVAREWVLRGAVPYRDVLDHKTPGIYILHGLSIWLFGERMVGIRVLELACVAALGLAAARLVVPRAKALPPGLWGLAWVAASVLYHGYLNWWDTAQSELWYTTLALGAAAVAHAARRERLGQVVAGTLAGSALLMKPPAAWLVLVAAAILTERAWAGREGRARRVALGLSSLTAGAGGVIALVLGYFAARGAMPALLDIVVGANSYYVAHERGIIDPSDVVGRTLDYVSVYNPFTTLGVLGLTALALRAWLARDRPAGVRLLLPVGACTAGFLAVAMQQKFYLLHWGVMVGPATLVMAFLAHEIASWTGRTSARAYATGVAGLLLAFVLSGHAVQDWWNDSRLGIGAALGISSRDAHVGRLAFPGIGFSYRDAELVGAWLRDHRAPGDAVAVRAFEPEIYAIAGMRHTGRFFWTTFLTQPTRAYHRPEWLAEDRRDLDLHPPRFAVVLGEATEGPDSAAYFPGYDTKVVFGRLVIMERAPR